MSQAFDTFCAVVCMVLALLFIAKLGRMVDDIHDIAVSQQSIATSLEYMRYHQGAK